MELGKEELVMAFSALAGVIAVLWTIVYTWSKREQERLAKCELMHEMTTKQMTDLTGKYNYLQGRMDGVEQLSASVLEKLNDIKIAQARNSS